MSHPELKNSGCLIFRVAKLLRHRRRGWRINAKGDARNQAVDERMPGVDGIVACSAGHCFGVRNADRRQAEQDVMVPLSNLLGPLGAFAHNACVRIAGSEKDGYGENNRQHLDGFSNHSRWIVG